MHRGFADQRQDRGVRDLEQKKANGKGDEAAVFEEIGTARPRRLGAMVVGSAAGLAVVDVGTAYPGERQKHREPQYGGHQQDVPDRQEVADNPHDPGRRQAADRREALIAAEPFPEPLVADEPEADRGDPRAEQASGHALYRRRSEDGREIRQQPVDQDHQDDGGRCRSDDRPLCFDNVDEFAAGNLGQQAGEAARRQTNPMLAGTQPRSAR
jgi:hypothetical protein